MCVGFNVVCPCSHNLWFLSDSVAVITGAGYDALRFLLLRRAQNTAKIAPLIRQMQRMPKATPGIHVDDHELKAASALQIDL